MMMIKSRSIDAIERPAKQSTKQQNRHDPCREVDGVVVVVVASTVVKQCSRLSVSSQHEERKVKKRVEKAD